MRSPDEQREYDRIETELNLLAQIYQRHSDMGQRSLILKKTIDLMKRQDELRDA